MKSCWSHGKRTMPIVVVVLTGLATLLGSNEGLILEAMSLKGKSMATRRVTHHHRSPLVMYFDDLSRHTTRWKPTSNFLTLGRHQSRPFWKKPQSVSEAPFLPPKSTTSSFLTSATYTEQKMDAIQRMIFGYNAASASSLAEAQVIKDMESWAHNAGTVGKKRGTALYQELLGVSVCNATSQVEAIAQFWKAILPLIDTSNNKGGTTSKAVHLITFPNCKELYDYKAMFTLVMAINLSKEICESLGHQFSLAIFHPNFKDSPKMMSPERHSPFPAVGIEFGTKLTETTSSRSNAAGKDILDLGSMAIRNKRLQLERLRQTSEGRDDEVDYEEEEEEEDSNYLVDIPIQNLDKTKKQLNQLFNSAAAFRDDEEKHDLPEKTGRGQLEHLAHDEVKKISIAWVEENRSTKQLGRNPALQYMDTVKSDGWAILDQIKAEEIYAEVWRVVTDLYRAGLEADAEGQVQMVEEIRPVDFIFSQREQKSETLQEKEGEGPPERIISSLIVATRFSAFQAQAWKRFAVTINAALKKLTNERMFLQVFHPESVSSGAADPNLRRSPYPMIQICYKVQNSKVE